jgi:NADH dehydrogenase/NADH:ubiquinone oxidoreductase subunit G
MTRSPNGHGVVPLTINGVVRDARPGELLIDVITRIGVEVPHVCYHPQLDPSKRATPAWSK